jgi:hypothetical protein
MKNTIIFLSKIFFLGLIVFGVSSCSQSGTSSIEESVEFSGDVEMCKTKSQANAILVNYLELQGEIYVLNISQEEAEKLGVPILLYEEALTDVKLTNESIKKAKEDSNTSIQLTDPKDDIKKKSDFREQALRSEYNEPIGNIETYGYTMMWSDLMWCEMYVTMVVFHCRSNTALVTCFSCSTITLDTVKTAAITGVSGRPAIAQVKVAASNTGIKVGFACYDSEGGKATFYGSMARPDDID